MKKAVPTALVALATLLGCELAARIASEGRGFASRHDERAAFAAKIPLQDSAATKDSALERVHGAAFTLHPFLGYTFRPSFEGANAQGFHGGVPSLPYRPAEDELVVGVFGGSVAMQVADAREHVVKILLPAARDRGWARVTVISFAIGGWRQPQHFNAMVRWLDEVDVIVLVEGFNEVIHLGDWHLARQPAEFPWSAVYAPLARQPSAAEALDRAELIRLHARAARFTRRLDAPLLRSSALVHLAWRAWAAGYESRVAALRRALENASFDGAAPERDPDAIALEREGYLRWWHELLLYSDAIARLRGKPFFHFVQPNQYDRGSKPLSPEERESFTRNAAWFDEVTPRYATVERMTRQLRAAGVDSTHLGRLFADTPQTVYVDDCCHFNRLGVEMLAGAVARHVAASGRIVARDADGRARLAHRDAVASPASSSLKSANADASEG
jgi:hypothetical protein